jgi:O-antigen/teichoic acid export membrane protein
VVDFWFQAHIQAKFTAMAMSASLFLVAVVKVLLVYMDAGLLLFAFANLLQTFLAACFLLLFFKATANMPFTTWRVNFSKAKELLSQSWIIFLGSIFATIYLKIDQVMIKWLVGLKEVGIYAVAAKFSEAWYFVPTAIVTSLFPKLIKLKVAEPVNFNIRLQQTFDLLFVIALVVALLVSLMAEPAIKLFFGDKYLESSSILTIHIWAALFVFMRAAFSKWILIENALVFSLITQGLGALANVGLNLVLIPHYAGYGAAVSTLLSYAMASYFSLFIYSKTRPIFWMMSKAMFTPVRYPLAYVKGKIA